MSLENELKKNTAAVLALTAALSGFNVDIEITPDAEDQVPVPEGEVKKGTPKTPPKTKAEKEDPAVTEEAAREALLALQKAKGREAALEVINKHSEKTNKFTGIPSSKYADLIADCLAAAGG